MESKIKRLKKLIDLIVSYEILRRKNIVELKKLFIELKIDQKVDKFEKLFEFKAMNLNGISLDKDEFGEIKEGKYIQIIAIESSKQKNKNINLKYFGRAERVDKKILKKIIEFVIRWRLEKSYKNLDHYKKLLEKAEEYGDR